MTQRIKNPRTMKLLRDDFVQRLVRMHSEAGQLELWRTMHKLHEVLRMVGYELAGAPELYDKMEREQNRILRRIQGQSDDT